MTPIGSVAASGDSIVEHVNRRFYPFTTALTQKFNTFTGPGVAITAPATRIATGVTVESGKLYEAAIENADSVVGAFPSGPNASSGFNYINTFDCIMLVTSVTAANIDSTAFTGIEILSQNNGVLDDVSVNGNVQLRWQLKDPTQWELVVWKGNGALGIHVPFTIPSSQAIGGHKVRLLWDPYELAVTAYVDDVVKAKQSIAGILPFFDATFGATYGVLLWNGNTTGVAGIRVGWMGATISTYNMHSVGAKVFA